MWEVGVGWDVGFVKDGNEWCDMSSVAEMQIYMECGISMPGRKGFE